MGESPWRPVAKRWDFSLLSWLNPVLFFLKKDDKRKKEKKLNSSLFSTGIKHAEQSRGYIHEFAGMFRRSSPCELKHWQTRNQGMWNTRGRKERKKRLGAVNRKQKGGVGGGPFNPSLRPFSCSRRHGPRGLALDAGFTSPLSVWLWHSNNAKCVKLKIKKVCVCVCMSSFKEKGLSLQKHPPFWNEHNVWIQDSRNSRSLIWAIWIPASREAGKGITQARREVFDFSFVETLLEKRWESHINMLNKPFPVTAELQRSHCRLRSEQVKTQIPNNQHCKFCKY